MKRIYGKLTTFLLVILSVALVFCAFLAIPSRSYAEETQSGVSGTASEWKNVSADGDSLTVTVDAGYITSGSLTVADLNELKADLVDALEVVLIDNLLNAPSAHTISTFGTFSLDTSVLGKYEDYIRDRLSQEGELEKYLNGEYDVMIKYAVSQYMEEHPDTDVKSIVDNVNQVVNEVIEDVYAGDRDKIDEAIGKNEQNVNTLVEDVKENGAASITVGEFMQMLKTLKFNGMLVYEDGGFDIAGVKQLLLTLPKPEELATGTGDILLDYRVEVESTVGDTGFDLTVGLTGDTSKLRSAAKFLSEHIDFVNDNGNITLNIRVPATVSKLLAAALNSERVPENVKLALFSLADKTGNEIVDDTDFYSYETVVEYIKGTDFHGIFSNLLDAAYLNNFVASYGGNFGEFTDAKIDSFLQKVLSFGKNLSNLSASEVSGFLNGLGLPGLPAKAEEAVNKFTEMLSNLDFERYDAAELKSLLKDEERLNGFIDRFTSNTSVKNAYDTLVDFAQRLFESLPARLQNAKPINLYDGDSRLSWNGNVSFKLQNAITKIANALSPDGDYASVILSYFSEESLNKVYSYNVDVNVSMPGTYKVAYELGDETKTGLLPAGADANFFAGVQSVNGHRILAWVDKDDSEAVYDVRESGAKVAMPERDITLVPATDFDVSVSVSDGGTAVSDSVYSRKYNGQAITLTAAAEGGSGYSADTLRYTWYKVSGSQRDEVSNSQSLTVTNVAESGTYVCEVKNVLSQDVVITAESAEGVTVNVTPAEVSFASADWDYEEPIVYDGNAHMVTLNGAPAGYPFEYKGEREGRDVGIYSVWIELENENYAITGLLQGTKDNPLDWEIVSAPKPTPQYKDYTFTLGDTTFRVRDVNGVLPANATLSVKYGTERGADQFSSFMPDGKTASVMFVYDISFTSFSGSGNFTVEMTNPAFGGKDIVIVHFHGAESDKLNAVISGNTITFSTANFSDFAVVEAQTEEEEGGLPWWIWLLVGIIILLLIIIIIIVIVILKKNDDNNKDVNPPVIIIKTEEAEEPESTEETVEEPEEAPEAVPEEPAEEPVEEPAEDETAAAVVVPVEDELYSVYDRSFNARLCQAQETIQQFYSDLKNDILSYKGVKSRVSWNYDAFNKGRIKCIRLQLRGKTLQMYIALNPADMDPKYHTKDVSDTVRYEDVPTMLKIKSARALKYAKELVAKLMEIIGAERGETPNVNYRQRFRSTNALIKSGDIKIKKTKNNFTSLKKPTEE